MFTKRFQIVWNTNIINFIIFQNELIYVNYGRVDDYRYLEKINVNVSGKIVIARYGKIFRGDKVCIHSYE